MALFKTLRARIILDLIKDGTVANEAVYTDGTVDKISWAVTVKYLDAVWTKFGTQLFEPDGVTPREPTDGEKAVLTINKLREVLADVIRIDRIEAAADTAREAERLIVNAEITADIGDPEAE